jgi:uncharacterized protein YebE (UPF0316 family)
MPTGPLLPLLVFAAETVVLTLATLRTIFIARGRKVPAALLGFFEVSIWLFAIGQVMQNLGSPACAVAFAAGFSLGNFLGVLIEQRLALGSLTVQITTTKDAGALLGALRAAGFGATKLDGHGATGPVHVVFTVVQRKDLPVVAALIAAFDAGAFYSVHDLQEAAEGVFPKREARGAMPSPLLRMWRVVVSRGRTGEAKGKGGRVAA